MAYPLHRAPSSAASAADSHPGAAFGVPASPDLPAIEREVLAYWDADDTFRASVERNPAGENGSNEFVFYDGPPFANGLPHYGHLLTGYAKDVVPRYQTMRGKHVERRFGWDTHGLPAELEAMDQLGIKTKEEILELGIERFNDACRASVLKYTSEWQDYVTRQARWVDFEHDYKTLDPTFMESVLWAFKQLYDKGLVYEGFRVLPYCWNDQTPLSNHELRMDEDVYQVRQDPAVTVGFRLETGELALIWTTTPWTLPSNLFVMVGPDVEYVVVESSFTGVTERYVIAAERLGAYARELADEGVEDVTTQVVERLTGADLVGRSYTPPFSYFAGHPGAHRVVEADFVTTTDGTGLVHNAGAFGEEDKVVSDREGVEPVLPVASDGKFVFPVVDYESLQVFDANALIIDHLKGRTRHDAAVAAGEAAPDLALGATSAGTVLLRRESYAHSYPHCWRCRQPLIYMGVSSWFVAVSTFKDRMVELNEQISWTPEHIQHGQFGKWLENARDWSITRNRFWGSPVPVWRSDDPQYPRVDVYGSFAELERDFGTLPRNEKGEPDLHRPFVDRLTRPNPDDPTGRSTMRRVEDVMDVWFDSGSMPYAQVHYPFENTDWFEHHNPGDFIVEYIGQTRGWFYTLHVLATALFDRPAFRSAVSHGIVLGSDGRKMSKSLRNYPDVNEVFDRDGSDAMRWFLMSSPILRGGNLVVTEDGIRDAVRQVLLPLWSTYYFFTLYANTSKAQARAGEPGGAAGYVAQKVAPERVAGLPALDRYLLARTHDLVVRVTEQLDAYDIAGACETVREHLDVLTNWYVRTQRDRFWAEDADAFDTLYTALETLTRVMAPLAPLLAEEVWRGLTGGRSVHLTDWPASTEEVGERFVGEDGSSAVAVRHVPDASLVADPALVAAMDEVRAVASAALGLRKAHQLRVRQPLARLTVVVDDPEALAPYTDLLARELNVKAVELESTDSDAAERFGITQRLAVNARAAGPRLGRGVQAVIKAAKAGAWRVDDAGEVVVTTDDGDVALLPAEYELTTVVAATRAGGPEPDAEAPSVAAAVLASGGFAVLDLALDDALLAEGYARDVIRDVQDARKAAGLDVADRIRLSLDVPGEWLVAVEEHRDLVARETLAVEVVLETSPTDVRSVRVEKADGTVPDTAVIL
ncbi:isoleucine--tRNA ligase [Cellulosimicrobium cellulans]|uniref:isoleucine--tRNA ligase n=1 Tax=Cellulosimicrobium cellulans TaxID=1710 RepID=UPI0020980F69|nr:isoleucine--tRNA ligase [Cellulosimicrobium cellulans]MCO7273049.1 isoleucine--tRNA ligase [Cellulosimicrobium cellulans]